MGNPAGTLPAHTTEKTMDFMRDGGFNMWLLVFAAVATVVVAVIRKPDERALTFLCGCIISLILGFLGISTGLQAVAAGYTKFPEPLAALAMGLRELSNNGILAALLATLQGMAALVTRRA